MANEKLRELPEQEMGGKMDVSSSRELESWEAALSFFKLAAFRLFNVNEWASYCGTDATTFQLCTEKGSLTQDLHEGSLIRIDIPGPGTAAGEGFDWVRIEEIKELEDSDERSVGFRVRPTSDPRNLKDDTAHFFTDEASSTFLVRLKGTTVFAEVHGRNEVPNTNTGQTLSNIRNSVVGWAARLGLSFPQWKLLVSGILSDEV